MTVVFTNGCFDVLHAGHVRLLKWASGFGDKLIVGLNSDASVRRLKGPGRPVFNQELRRELLEELSWVHRVRIFEEDTPVELIKQIRPQVLIKGPGQKRPIPGEVDVVSWGGYVAIPNWSVDVSTSSILDRLQCTA